MTDEGPFREGDPVRSKLHEIQRTQETHGSALGELLAASRKPMVGVVQAFAPWLGWPMVIVAVLLGFGLLDRYGNEGCAARDKEAYREKEADAVAELHAHDRFCAAVGLRFAGTTPVHTVHTADRYGNPYSDTVYYAVVCGNGHGDGMYVGVDGHLHALKGR
jgi:hypothetical protein